jgi:hypothetical protein
MISDFADTDPSELDPNLLETSVHLKYERQLRNLYLQESRLVRRREKELAELRELQKDRAAREQEQADQPPAAQPPQTTHPNSISAQPLPDLLQNGFEFSTIAPDETSDPSAVPENAFPHAQAA